MTPLEPVKPAKRGPLWGFLGRGPDYCVICFEPLKPLPSYCARRPNPTCRSTACRRELRRSWRLYRFGAQTCPVCGDAFAASRRGAVYCGDRCRQRAHRTAARE